MKTTCLPLRKGGDEKKGGMEKRRKGEMWGEKRREKRRKERGVEREKSGLGGKKESEKLKVLIFQRKKREREREKKAKNERGEKKKPELLLEVGGKNVVETAVVVQEDVRDNNDDGLLASPHISLSGREEGQITNFGTLRGINVLLKIDEGLSEGLLKAIDILLEDFSSPVSRSCHCKR